MRGVAAQRGSDARAGAGRFTLTTMSARADAQVPAVPDDVDDPRHAKASGIVVLPLHIDWHGEPRRYDLDDPQQRARVYEQVLREGNDDDIRHFIDVDRLQALWTRLWLPRRVRAV